MTNVIIESKDISDLFKYIHSNTLIIFDIDNTLISPCQMIGTEYWEKKLYNSFLLKGYHEKLANLHAHHLWQKVQYLTDVKWVEKKTPSILADLQGKKMDIMGLTSRSVGLEMLTYKQFQSLSFDLPFSSFINTDKVTRLNSYCRFVNGILFCGPSTKGESFHSLLSIVNIVPPHVIFIDDRIDHIENMSAKLKEISIPFVGIHYTAMDIYNNKYDDRIANLQLNYIDKILTDEEAEILLKIDD